MNIKTIKVDMRRVKLLELGLQDIIDGKHDGSGNESELDVVVEIAKELLLMIGE